MKVFDFLKKNKDLIFELLLCLSVVSLPFSLRMNSLSVFALAIAWIFQEPFANRIKRLSNPLLLLFISFYLCYLVGMLWTVNIKYGFWELEKKMGLLVFPIIIGTTKPLTNKAFMRILQCFVIAILLASLTCLAHATYRAIALNALSVVDPQTQQTIYFYFYDGLSGFMIQPVYLSAYVVTSVFILLFLYAKRGLLSDELFKVFRNRAFIWIGIILLIAVLLMLSARIMILALVMLSFFLIVFFLRQKGRFVLGISTGVLSIVILGVSIHYVPFLRSRFEVVINSSFHFENDPERNKKLSGQLDDVNMRLAKWYFTLEAGKDKWFLGNGTGDGQDALMNKYLENNFMEGYIPQYNSHNQYLQTWLSLGMVGLIIMLCTICVPIYLAFKSGNILYLVFLGLILLFCITESIFSRQYGVVFYSFFNSLFAFHLNTVSFNFVKVA